VFVSSSSSSSGEFWPTHTHKQQNYRYAITPTTPSFYLYIRIRDESMTVCPGSPPPAPTFSITLNESYECVLLVYLSTPPPPSSSRHSITWKQSRNNIKFNKALPTYPTRQTVYIYKGDTSAHTVGTDPKVAKEQRTPRSYDDDIMMPCLPRYGTWYPPLSDMAHTA